MADGSDPLSKLVMNEMSAQDRVFVRLGVGRSGILSPCILVNFNRTPKRTKPYTEY